MEFTDGPTAISTTVESFCWEQNIVRTKELNKQICYVPIK